MDFEHIGIYAGSFDPITLGHLDIIRRACHFCDSVIVAIGTNPSKSNLFSLDERKSLISNSLFEYSKMESYLPIRQIKVADFSGLLVDYAAAFSHDENQVSLIRGLRTANDFEYEANLANINKYLKRSIETIVLISEPEFSIVSSSAAKEIAKYQGDLKNFVTPNVAESLNEKFAKK